MVLEDIVYVCIAILINRSAPQDNFCRSVGNYTEVAASVLSLKDETTLIWKRKFSLGSILYLLARYCCVAAATLSVLPEGIFALYVGRGVLELVSDVCGLSAIISTQGLLIARAYGISGGRAVVRTALGLLLAVYAGSFFVAVVLAAIRLVTLPVAAQLTIIAQLCGTVIAFHEETYQSRLAGVVIGDLGLVIPTILVCKFMLQLRKFTSSVQTTPSIHIASNSGIRRQLHRLNESILEEFGNSGIHLNEVDSQIWDLEAELEVMLSPAGSIDTPVHLGAHETHGQYAVQSNPSGLVNRTENTL
ncbi:hypothetical protein M422DRAFT_256208 [Sphaerobolus stellatus SS14]|uniref:DUF6533 domain-containing protein n=1 Tax=Sphaerobolus stellatus (strain SS14) TaxID=990650 RepID=A0A0C9UCG5_SPHS4|nr:hypothetical protein M422DRAFT_256208 [Sphaerobolus stellatus SS14]